MATRDQMVDSGATVGEEMGRRYLGKESLREVRRLVSG